MIPSNLTQLSVAAAFLTVLASSLPAAASGAEKAAPDKTIAIADLSRTSPVDFEKEILPILKSNCLACHNQTKPKAELVLETPQTILKGGESGPAVIPKNSAKSLLLTVAAHQEEPRMPPKGNKVFASDLTPHELGLIKLWIDQGATGEVRGADPIQWQPLPLNINPIYAVSLSPDGQFAACGRGNQIFIYHVPTKRLLQTLSDSALAQRPGFETAGAAHLDLVHSLTFHPDGDLLASGGYREIKLWRRPQDARTLKISFAASDKLQALAASSDGQWLAIGSADSTIKIWNLADGKLLKALPGHSKPVTSLKFSPDNSKLASVSEDKSLRIWTLPDGEPFAQADATAELNAVAWLPSGAQLATGGADNILTVWTLPGDFAKPLTSAEFKGHQGPITTLDAIPSAPKHLITGSQDGTIRRWDMETGKVVREWKHESPVAALAVRADGKRLASAGLNKSTRLWDLEAGSEKPLAEIRGTRAALRWVEHRERESAFANSEVTYRKNSLQTSEKTHQTETERVKKAVDSKAAAETAFTEKEKALATAKETKTASEKALTELNEEIKRATELFQTADKAAKEAAVEAKNALEKATQAKLAADQAAGAKRESERMAADAAAVAARTKSPAADAPGASKLSETMAAEAAAVAAKVKAFAESVAEDSNAKAKLAAEAKAAAEKAIDELAAKSYAAGQAKVSHDKLASEGPDRQKQATEKVAAATKALSEAEAQLKKAEQTRSNAASELELASSSVKQTEQALAAAKQNLAKAENLAKKNASDLDAAKTLFADSQQPIRALAFSPDGHTLATAGDDERVHTWSAENGQPLESYKGHIGPIFAVAFAPNNLLISAGSDQSAIVWNPNPGWILERIIGASDNDSPLSDRVNALRFSPDGQVLASGSGEPTRGSEIKLWNVSDGSLVKDFSNVHSDSVLTLDFSPDGVLLASGAADRFVKVLELSSGKILKALEGHTHHVLGVSWKRDGRTLASAGADNVIKIWDVTTGERKKNIEGFAKEVTSIAFITGTDQALASSGDNQVRLVRENGENVRTFNGGSDFVYAAVATPDGKFVVAGGQDSVLRVWNGGNGESITAFHPNKPGE